MPLIDTHVHLYDTTRFRYDWLAGLGDLDRSHLLDEYRKASAGDVSGIVFVEVDCRDDEGIAEAEWVAAQAEGTPPVLGIVAFAPAESDALSGHLDRLAEVSLVRGVRRLIEPTPDDFTALTPFRRGLAQIGARGLTFDVCCTSRQLVGVVELVAALPEVAFVLDHLGKPDIAGGEWEPWAGQLAQLASFDNVVAAKLSGLFSQGPASEVGRYLAHALESFGPARLMVGSDWPVCDQKGSHVGWVAAVEDAIAGLSSSEQAEVRHGTATSAYRLGDCGADA